MDDVSENVDNSDDIVIIVENEAESLPAAEEEGRRPGGGSASGSGSSAAAGSMGGFGLMDTCPECWEMDVLDNFFVKDSAELPSSTVEKNSQATGYCVECVEFLCVTCIEAHQRVKFTRDHTIRQKEEMSPEAVGMSTPRPVFCDVHKQEPLKLFCETYQFLEDAYRNHRQYLENMTQQLQQKRKAIEEVSTCISSGLQQVDENRKSVTNEIKKSICSLIMEINRKGKILVNQLETLTKDHELGLKKQQEEVCSLTRHLDHVIRFTKWATSSHSHHGPALLQET
ncbi:hypothetical protein CRUP_032510, partial [Coryphaenoides rupestris]